MDYVFLGISYDRSILSSYATFVGESSPTGSLNNWQGARARPRALQDYMPIILMIHTET